ncbi:SGNH hydrolase domain-containing protein [Arthrobacter sp. SA17]
MGEQVTQRILKDKPDMIFTSSFGAGETVDDGTGRPQSEQYRDGVAGRFGAWMEAGSDIFVLRDTPLTLGHSSPECVALNVENPLNCANRRSEALPADPVAEAAHRLDSPQVKVLDLSDQFCTADLCHAVIGGLQVYFDNDHASRSYILSTVPVLAARFDEASQ